MLIDTTITVAYKCTSCGSFEFFNVSIFKLLYNEYSLACRCKKSCITMRREGGNSFLISIPCIGCDDEHTYLFTKKSILFGEPVVFNCPETGMQICFVGRDEAVCNKIDDLEKEFDELMDTYGYESYFRNTRVMIDTLNRIHDIALCGSIICECGGSDIELVLLSDCILLRCGRCGGSKRIPAAKNSDLKNMLAMNQILITKEAFQYRKGLLSGQSGNKLGK
jgi:hypothetical protein